ncbi:hypothetical protein MO973_40455 [Paenibacillus sp. TRM 82003]|uniref:hypothetical protein n=1 Tax=Kineococcus sp. TRM81007 TaxID=2925831 RepID=UPI001F56F971|nr:hypothetical protein [Kineococcus sp. TRM81007]MCI2237060.1 hypothetical protein [Kineococcus sp. TRM81007]MCI3926473.1 hypothetical protein [Paenibacillus sp. TRM 82003]
MSTSRPVRWGAALLIVVSPVACGSEQAPGAAEPTTTSSLATTSLAPSAPGAEPTATAKALRWDEDHLTGSEGTFTWDVTVPRAAGPAVAAEVNRRVVASAEDVIDAARASVLDGDPPRTLTGEGTVTTDDGRTVQVVLEFVDSTEGTAHPTTSVTTVVLDVERERPVVLGDVFDDPRAAFEELALVVEEVADAAGQPVTEPEGLSPQEANWAAWQSGEDGITFWFQDYQLGGHGTRQYLVPWDRAGHLLTPAARELLAPV